MIVRELDTGIIVKIYGVSDEDQFLSVNPTGGFSKVESLPPSASQQWIRINGTIISNPAADLEIENGMYANARKAEYPPIEDYIDGIVKGSQEQIDEYIAKCLAVKEKYQKPE